MEQKKKNGIQFDLIIVSVCMLIGSEIIDQHIVANSAQTADDENNWNTANRHNQSR